MVGLMISRWASLIIKCMASAGLLELLLSLNKTLGSSVDLKSVPPLTIVVVILIVLFQISIVSAWRLRLVMQLLGARLNAIDAARIAWCGSFAEQAGAVFVAGDVARIWLLRQACIPLHSATEAPIVDRIIGFATILAMAAFGMPQLWSSLSGGQQHWLLLGMVAVATATATLALLGVLFLDLKGLSVRLLPFVNALCTVIKGFRRLSLTRLVVVVLLALTTHSLNVVAIYLLLGAVGLKVALGACFVFVPTVLLASMLPISLSGWGVREGALMLALQGMGLSSGAVLTASILFGACVLTASLPGVVIWLTIPARRDQISTASGAASAILDDPLKFSR